jgi:predicted esterase
MRPESIQHCTFPARLDCHYLLYTPEAITGETALVVALHGFGQTPETMLRLTWMMLGGKHAIAAVQGPNQFFLAPDRKEVGYCWITDQHADSSIRLHHDMLLHVLNEAGQQLGIGPGRRVLVGFSQPVGLNYRFAATHAEAVHGVIGICGGLPRNWETGPYGRTSAALMHIARREDEFYDPEVTGRYAERLRLRADDVEFHMLEGGHRFPSKAGPLVEQWMARVLQFKQSPKETGGSDLRPD